LAEGSPIQAKKGKRFNVSKTRPVISGDKPGCSPTNSRFADVAAASSRALAQWL